MNINASAVNISDNNSANARVDRRADQNSRVKNGGFFAGNINLQDDRIERKRKEAMKQALKIVGDAFDGDRSIDDDLERRRTRVTDLTKEIGVEQGEINKLEARKTELKDALGITEDSPEQQDLKLLEKRRDSLKNPDIRLTDEENQRLTQIDNTGMTEYQKFSLEIDALNEPRKKLIAEKQNSIVNENKTIEGIKLERLKTHPMVDADIAADKIKDAANKEVIGMLIDEAKDQIDQKMKEQKDAADKKAEEKKTQDDKIAAETKKKEEADALAGKGQSDHGNNDISIREDKTYPNSADQLLNLDGTKKNVRKEVQGILDKMKLLQEDIKGAAIDTNI